MVKLSILELGRVREGFDTRDALNRARELGIHAEANGFERIWVAEHHNMKGVSTAATPVVIGHIAGATSTIRVGAGGVMLPNHTPYVIAEHFGTLATLYPDRIDLGLGRAPGTDQMTLRALRVDPMKAERFPQDVLELQRWLGDEEDDQRLHAVPGVGTKVPLWILGSSLFGAQLASQLGLPYGFASHFAPGALDPALKLYRERFEPSDALAKPYALVGVNVIAADTDEAAKKLATSQQMSFANMVRGQRGLMQPPINDIDDYWLPHEKAHAEQMLACSIIGGPETVRKGLEAFVERTQADELMIVSDMYEPSARLKSLEIIADVMGAKAKTPA
ncbi:LLM class flavin-dependent oxidoreductase [Ponticaulis sp.]|uniref:LLM class flavin-dependent oxidoreductase n=1 Tax=Ponticaulis sp. TaxID=2020902 RepID=UPI000B6CBBE3|nr:LLM class flavin-dependent oxidoreductase [Ponticaulis sp.]MAI90918.1 alkane 1-monooxygenase [Ponticaulis sp.]OUX98262.1 MAG: alkane 1-monooxygenase [Hyphomonadaceae bacterium TMED5]|tara:strand:- start:23746 stop:24747 length:1002 start_codon:yes stop_codon:yes gene_type:complete